MITATSTFVRKIVISSPEALKRLEKVMEDQTPKEPISEHPFSNEDRKYGIALLKRCQLRTHLLVDGQENDTLME